MSNMQYEQPRGLAAAAHQQAAQNQYSYPQPQMYAYASENPHVDYHQEIQPLQPIGSPVRQQSYFNHPQTPQQPFSGSEHQHQYQHQNPPPLPQRHASHSYNGHRVIDFQYRQQNEAQAQTHTQQQPPSPYEQTPPLPPRSHRRNGSDPANNLPEPDGSALAGGYVPPPPPQRIDHHGTENFGETNPTRFGGYVPPPPPQRMENSFAAEDDDPSSPVHYIRDPHKLVAYLVPFPKPHIEGVDPSTVPTRFLIYTPPPPPLAAPKEGEKEAKLHKVQRKWQQEVRSAKTSNAKVTSWKGMKSRATKAIAWGVNQTTTSNLEFLGRVKDGSTGDGGSASGRSSTDSEPGSPTTKKTMGVDEILLVYPPDIGLDDQQMRAEFVNTMLRTKSKAQRDSIIATGLLPVGYGIDILATFVWPFGGLGEIDTVWLYSSARGAKTARNVTKRLTSSSESGDLEKDTLQLNFTPSQRLAILERYLQAECQRVDSAKFPEYHTPTTETEVLAAIGWSPSQVEKNWEDEQWELQEVKEDLKSNMHKAAKEWKKFCVAFAKDPEKALKKK